jgi:hypothetical protein
MAVYDHIAGARVFGVMNGVEDLDWSNQQEIVGLSRRVQVITADQQIYDISLQICNTQDNPEGYLPSHPYHLSGVATWGGTDYLFQAVAPPDEHSGVLVLAPMVAEVPLERGWNGQPKENFFYKRALRGVH